MGCALRALCLFTKKSGGCPLLRPPSATNNSILAQRHVDCKDGAIRVKFALNPAHSRGILAEVGAVIPREVRRGFDSLE
jgi:hypothetical protein